MSLSLHVANIHVPNDYIEFLNGSSTGRLRPFVPRSARTFYSSCIIYRILAQMHLSDSLQTNLYSPPWNLIFIPQWNIAYIASKQKSEDTHTYTLDSFIDTGECFAHVYADITRALPQCVGNDYLLTCVDHFTCRYEVFPMSDIIGYITGENFILNLVCHFF